MRPSERANRRQISETKRLDDILDKLNTAIKAYITSLDPEELSEDDHRAAAGNTDLRHQHGNAGDIVDKNLLGIANKMVKRGVTFSKIRPGGDAGDDRSADRQRPNVRVAVHDWRRAGGADARFGKEVFRSMETTATEAHFERLRSGHMETAETSTMHLDTLRDLKSVNSHLVAAAAYPVLERTGVLLPTRLRQEG